MSSSANSAGAVVALARSANAKNWITSYANGAILGGLGNDCRAAFLAAKAYSGHVHFPRLDGKPTVYYFAATSAGDFDAATTLSCDDGVSLSLPSASPYPQYAASPALNDIPISFRDISISHHIVAQQPLNQKPLARPVQDLAARKQSSLDMTSSAVSYRSVVWNTSDTFTAAVPSASTARSATLNYVAGSFTGAFVSIGLHETVSAMMPFLQGSANVTGIIVRGALGFVAFYRQANSVGGSIVYGIKLTGSGETQTNLAYPGQGVYNSFEPDRSVWSVTRVSKDAYSVSLNGRPITSPLLAGLGDIYEVGFVGYATASAGSFTVQDLIVEWRENGIHTESAPLNIAIFGDSTAADFQGCWARYLPQLLDCNYGIKLVSVTNNAVNGQALQDMWNTMQAVGLGNAYYVVLVGGTNDVQGLANLATSGGYLLDMINYVQAAGRQLIYVEPWMWYPAAQIGGAGQPSQNYDQAAAYRQYFKRLCLDNNCQYVETTRELPYPDPSYFGSARSMLRDDIHQDQAGYIMYAEMIARAVLGSYLVSPPVEICGLDPAACLSAGVSAAGSGLLASVSRERNVQLGDYVTTAAGVANGTVLLTLPRWLRPSKQLHMPATYSQGNINFVGGYYLIGTDGTIQAWGSGASTTFFLSSISFPVDCYRDIKYGRLR